MLNKYIEDNNIDILAVQETETSNDSKLELLNMTCIKDCNNSANKGCAMYFRNDGPTVVVLEEIAKKSVTIDSVWNLVMHNGKRYIMGTVYAKLQYDNSIAEIISMLSEAERLQASYHACGILVIGDFNARHFLWNDSVCNRYGNILINQLDFTKYFIKSSDKPTFLASNGSSYIDLCLVSNKLKEHLCDIKTDDTAILYSGAPKRGHIPLITTLVTTPRQYNTKPKATIKTDIKSINWNTWSDLHESKIEGINSDKNTAAEIWERFKILTNDVNAHCARKKISTVHSKPFWNKHLSELAIKMKSAQKQYIMRNTDQNAEKFSNAKFDFDTARKKACQDFLLNKTHDLNAAEAQRFWKQFNKMFKKRSNCNIGPFVTADNKIIDKAEDLEDELFETFFAGRHMSENINSFDMEFYNQVNSIYSRIVSKSKIMETLVDQHSTINSSLPFDINSEITISEIRESIANTDCSISKSFDNDGIHPMMLKRIGKGATELLGSLFNKCLREEQWTWNVADIIFPRKAGKKTYSKAGSYRPISITSYVGKLFEKIMVNRLERFLTYSKISDGSQEGFTKGKNTIRYLNQLNMGIKSKLEKKYTVLCLFIDMEKAFDSVWKKGLIFKLYNAGVRGNFLNLLDSFLMTRKVRLIVNNVVGCLRSCLEYGLPQGSVLSPILFKFYLTDFGSELNDLPGVMLLKFADDGTVLCDAPSSESCLEKFNLVLKSLQTWCEKWRMVVNCDTDKTEYICFGRAKNDLTPIPTKMALGSKTINQVEETKVLGLTIDSKLSFDSHAKNVYSNLVFRWSMICQHCNRNWGFNIKIMTRLLQTLFLSSLHYAGFIWMTKRNMTCIEKLWYKLKKSAVGAVFNVKSSTSDLIIGIPPIHIQSEINMIKHFLKVNIVAAQDDQLKQLISSLTHSGNSCRVLSQNLRSVYKFLKWKLSFNSKNNVERDIIIINQNNFSKFHKLSKSTCSYTKPMIVKYTESLWQKALVNEYQIGGETHIPKASCKKISFPLNVSRETEVLVMSLLYKNNLLNYNLNKFASLLYPSPLCGCGEGVQTAFHVLFKCTGDTSNQSTATETINELYSALENLDNIDLMYMDCVTFLNAIKDLRVLKLFVSRIDECQVYLKTNVLL